MSKECANNLQELLAVMMYWANTNGTKIDTAVSFVKLEIEEMVLKLSTQEAQWQCMKAQRVGFHH